MPRVWSDTDMLTSTHGKSGTHKITERYAMNKTLEDSDAGRLVGIHHSTDTSCGHDSTASDTYFPTKTLSKKSPTATWIWTKYHGVKLICSVPPCWWQFKRGTSAGQPPSIASESGDSSVAILLTSGDDTAKHWPVVVTSSTGFPISVL